MGITPNHQHCISGVLFSNIMNTDNTSYVGLFPLLDTAQYKDLCNSNIVLKGWSFNGT